VAEMAYCEAWLGARKVKEPNGEEKTEFRVELATPPKFDLPLGYTPTDEEAENPDKKVYSSPWLKTIESAKDELIKIDSFCKNKGYKVLIYFEIRSAF
jgi:hypothetical protein